MSLHPSWFIILIVLVWSLAESVFPSAYPYWSPTTCWVVALAAALLLFLSVLAHEFAHSFVARRQGIKVTGITLYLLGGVANIAEEPRSPAREALMAGLGPLTSFVIGLGAWSASRVVVWSEPLQAILLYLGYVNVVLAVFNLLPGFPLDGGRVLRAAIWAVTKDQERATRGAARAGQVIGWGLVLLGVLWAFTAGVVGGVWMGFIGWTLVQASHSILSRSSTTHRLAGLRVADLMARPGGWIPPDVPLAQATERYFIPLGARCLPVSDDGRRIRGVLCVADLERSDRPLWPAATAADAMTPLADLHTIDPEAAATTALQRLADDETGCLAAVSDGRLVGFVDRTTLLSFLESGGRPRDVTGSSSAPGAGPSTAA